MAATVGQRAMKTFRIFLQNGLTCDVVAAKIECVVKSDRLDAAAICLLAEGEDIVAEFPKSCVAGYTIVGTSHSKNVIA